MRLFTCIIALVLSVMTASAKPITREVAQKKAAAFMAQQRDFRRLTPVVSAQKLRLKTASATTGQTADPYYVFDRGTDEGFVIVSGDDQTIDVLGYSEKGSFDYDNLPEALQDLLDDYARQLQLIQQGAPVVKLPANHPKVGQLMTSKWSQGSPYNLTCPLDGGNRSVTGCVATAMAQILYYNREKMPTETQAAMPAYSTWTKGIQVPGIASGAPIDWDNMKDTYGSANDLQKKAVANLMLYCGVGVKMDYTSSSSGAQSSDAHAAFVKYFGCSQARFVTYADVSTDDEWDRIVYQEMAAGRPVYLSGSNATVGHAFVADGYENQRYHINWGWGGQSDGMYYLTNLTPGDGQGIGGSSDGYNGWKQIVVNIEPDNYMEKKITISDTKARDICLANFDTNSDGKLTYGELAAITSLGTAFKGQTAIKSFAELYYFTSLTELPEDAFNGCSALTTLRLPKSLKKVGARAFKDCAQLRQINLPTSVNTIGQEAFSGCKLLSAFELPEEIEVIEAGTFKDCALLPSIVLPLTVSKIDNEAFSGCTNLNSFTVKTFQPASITMGSNVFSNTNLSTAKLYVKQGTKAYFTAASQWQDFGTIIEERERSGGEFATIEAGKVYYLYNVGMGRYLTKGEAYGTQAVVGDEPLRFKANHTASMAEDVYYFTTPDIENKNLFRTTNDANVGKGVKALFVDGANMTQASCYWKVSSVSDKVYTIQVPATVTAYYKEGEYLGVQTDHKSGAASPTYGAYFDVEYATHRLGCQWQFVLYDEAKAANYEAAQTLGNLLSTAKKRSLKTADEQAVYDNLESTVEQLQAAQSSLRKKLNFIDFKETAIRDLCISLFDSDTDGELSMKEASDVSDIGYMFYFSNNTSIKTFDEFQYFSNIGEIYGNTFDGCTNLTSVIIPKNVEKIYYQAFMNCKKLTAINIPANVTLVGDNAFYGCSALREVTVQANDPANISLGNNVFGGVSLAQCTLRVPFGTKELYAAANVWKNFGNIVEVRGTTQAKFSPIETNKPGYLYHIGTHKIITMGEAYGTQSVVGRTGRIYELRRTNSMADGVYYLYDTETGKTVFRTTKDSKVGEGTKACFGDGNISTSSYWQIQPVDSLLFTMQVPQSDENYIANEYLGASPTRASSYTDPSYGIYWDFSGVSKDTQWAFISVDDMKAAKEMDELAEKLKEMIAKAKEQELNVTDEQAVYDNAASTSIDLRAALKSVRDKLHFITFADDAAQTVCLTNWDENEDGELTFEEAAQVTSIGELFRGNDKLKYFEELKYFTGLTEIPSDAFRNASNLVALYLPKNIQTIGSNAFMASSKLRNLVITNDTQLIPFGNCYLSAQATVFLPGNMLASYEADETWNSKVKLLTEYTGKPVVTAKASRIYGRNTASISAVVMGAPVEGEPETECAAIKDRYLPVGKYPITLTIGTIVTPGTELVEGVFTIEPAPLTITAKSYTRNVGEANPEFEVTYKSFRNSENEDVLTSKPVITCEATAESPAGEYEITVSGAEAQNYDITYVAGKLTVVDPLGVESVKADPAGSQPLYDMQGRRVEQPKRGIYVSGNRKVVIR